MKQVKINGFDSTEIFLLYAYIDAYECMDLKHITEESLFKQYPHIQKLKNYIKICGCAEKTKEELKRVDIDSLEKGFFYTPRNSLLLGLLYHLRNSISHAKITKKGDVVTIFDYSANESPQCTTKGKMSYQILSQIIEIIKK